MPIQVKIEYKAVALNQWVTAREVPGGSILVFRQSDCTEAGHIEPPAEIFLTEIEIEKLHREFCVHGQDEGANNA